VVGRQAAQLSVALTPPCVALTRLAAAWMAPCVAHPAAACPAPHLAGRPPRSPWPSLPSRRGPSCPAPPRGQRAPHSGQARLHQHQPQQGPQSRRPSSCALASPPPPLPQRCRPPSSPQPQPQEQRPPAPSSPAPPSRAAQPQSGSSSPPWPTPASWNWPPATTTCWQAAIRPRPPPGPAGARRQRRQRQRQRQQGPTPRPLGGSACRRPQISPCPYQRAAPLLLERRQGRLVCSAAGRPSARRWHYQQAATAAMATEDLLLRACRRRSWSRRPLPPSSRSSW
jgi:hypothetical protein